MNKDKQPIKLDPSGIIKITCFDKDNICIEENKLANFKKLVATKQLTPTERYRDVLSFVSPDNEKPDAYVNLEKTYKYGEYCLDHHRQHVEAKADIYTNPNLPDLVKVSIPIPKKEGGGKLVRFMFNHESTFEMLKVFKSRFCENYYF